MIDQTQIEAWSNLLVSSLHSSGEFCGNGTVALVEFRAMFAPMRGGGCCASLSEETRARPMRAYRANKELPGATVQGIVPPREAGGASGAADQQDATGWHNGADELTVAQIADALEEALAATSGLSPFFAGTDAKPKVHYADPVDVDVISPTATTKVDHPIISEDDLPQFTFDADGELRGFRLAGLNWRSDDGYVWIAEQDGRQHKIKGLLSLESDGTLQFESRLSEETTSVPAYAPSITPKFLTRTKSSPSRSRQYRRLRALECAVQSQPTHPTQPTIHWDGGWQILLSQCKAVLPTYQKMGHAGAY